MSRDQDLGQKQSQTRNFVVGRGDEQSRLNMLLNSLEQEHGRFVLVSGEAGIGKTALVEDLAKLAEYRGHLVCISHCYQFLSQSPYGAWMSILRGLSHEAQVTRQVIEGIDRPTSGRAEIPSQEHLYDTVAQLIWDTSQDRPVVLIVEDIHWADQASLDLLHYLTRHPIEQPVLFLVTYRDTELDRQAYLYQLLPSLIRDGQAERIELRRLGESAVRELIEHTYQLSEADVLRLTEFVLRLAEGNPFITRELLSSLEHQGVLTPRPSGLWRLGDLNGIRVPPLVRQIIDLRLAALAEETRRALDAGAVIGGHIPFDLWQRVTGIPEDFLADIIKEALQARLLVEILSRAEFSFDHELVRETLYQELPLPLRRAYHRAVAETLANEVNTDPSIVANHFSAAVDTRAADWHFRAGLHAQSVYAPHDAVIHLNKALAHAEDLSAAQRREAHTVRARSYVLVGDFDNARSDLDSALQLARQEDDDRAQWEVLIDLGMLWAERDYARTYTYLEGALTLARSSGDSATLGNSLNRIGNWYLNDDQPSRAASYHLDALESFNEAGDQTGIADTLDLLGLTRYMGGDPFAAAVNTREAVSLFRTLERWEGLSSSLVNLTLYGGNYETITMLPAYESGEESIGYGEEALGVARDIEWLAGEAFALSQIAMVLGVRGDYARALEAAEGGSRIAEGIGHRQWISASYLSLGWINADLLQLPRARVHFERSRALAQEINSRFWYRSATAMLARVHLLLGDAYRANALLDQCLAPSDGMKTIGERSCWLVRSELELASGDAQTSLEITERLIRTATGMGPGDIIPDLWQMRAEAMRKLCRADEAVEVLQLALSRAVELDWPATIWRIAVSLARAYIARDDGQAAADILSDAESVMNRIAETIPDETLRYNYLQEARALLPDVRQHASRRDRFRPLDLTPREVEVLRLVANGQTDREIADLLSISPRTVMNHVSNIFNKLGVNSRAAATAHAVRKGLI